jgi:hypothetical protein
LVTPGAFACGFQQVSMGSITDVVPAGASASEAFQLMLHERVCQLEGLAAHQVLAAPEVLGILSKIETLLADEESLVRRAANANMNGLYWGLSKLEDKLEFTVEVPDTRTVPFHHRRRAAVMAMDLYAGGLGDLKVRAPMLADVQVEVVISREGQVARIVRDEIERDERRRQQRLERVRALHEEQERARAVQAAAEQAAKARDQAARDQAARDQADREREQAAKARDRAESGQAARGHARPGLFRLFRHR